MAARATSCPCSERRSERMAPKGGAATEPGGDGRRRPGHRRGELRQSPGGEGRRRPGRSAQPREAWRSVLVGVQGSGGASSWASWEARTSNAQRKASGWLSARELSCQRESSTPNVLSLLPVFGGERDAGVSRRRTPRRRRRRRPRGHRPRRRLSPILSALNLSCSRGVCLCTRFITSDLTPWLAAT